MLFNSNEYIFLFLPIAFFVYFYLNSKRLTVASKAWLVFASLFFYSWWNIAYLPLILISILFNYTISNLMIEYNAKKKSYFSKKFLLKIGLLFNIGLLGYFKYADFFIENVNVIFNSNVELLHLALPLAISFFTLQQVAFLVDSYEGLVKERDFLNYTLFVTFFPQLIAGPIVHHKEMMPQFNNIRNKVKNYKNIALGLFIFSIGLFKKVVIADTFAIWATDGFDNALSLNFFEGWATSLSYTLQLYFDFSGYTDMAVGAALLFNIKLPINFNSPYKSTSIIEFWQRWHITLSQFITSYIFVPLVKLFKKPTFTSMMMAIFIATLISGLWHGASWTFIAYGALHGIALVINHIYKKYKLPMSKFWGWFLTINFVNISFVFFRAKDLDSAMKVLNGMFSLDTTFNLNYVELMIIFIGCIVVLFFRNSVSYLNKKFDFSVMQMLIFVIFVSVSILVMRVGKTSEFLYFNF